MHVATLFDGALAATRMAWRRGDLGDPCSRAPVGPSRKLLMPLLALGIVWLADLGLPSAAHADSIAPFDRRMSSRNASGV